MKIYLKTIEFRKKLNMTQVELAKALELEQSSISRIENGTLIPSIETTKKIAKVLNASLDELVDWRPDDSDPKSLRNALESSILMGVKLSDYLKYVETHEKYSTEMAEVMGTDKIIAKYGKTRTDK